MTTRTKLLFLASALIGVILIGIITLGIVRLVLNNKSQSTSTKNLTAQGVIESGKGPLGPAKIAKSTIPPVSRVQVEVTKNGFQPNKLNVRVNTILQIYNTTGEIFYLKSVGEKNLNVPNVLPPSSPKLELGIGYTGSYKLVNQKNKSQTLEITVKK